MYNITGILCGYIIFLLFHSDKIQYLHMIHPHFKKACFFAAETQ